MSGTIHGKKTLLFRAHVGVVRDSSDKEVFELGTVVSSCAPVIRSKKTGKFFTLSWQELVEMAVAAGIDKEDQEPKTD